MRAIVGVCSLCGGRGIALPTEMLPVRLRERLARSAARVLQGHGNDVSDQPLAGRYAFYMTRHRSVDGGICPAGSPWLRTAEENGAYCLIS